MTTIRLDKLMTDRGLASSREKAQALVLAGVVWSGNQRLDKPGTQVREDLDVDVRSTALAFASRGGEKLSHALTHFKVSVDGRVCLDIGASTGGFTDCLLQNGAKHVFSIDVGYGQIDQKLRENPAVTVLDRTNARHLTAEVFGAQWPLAQSAAVVVMDVSFISMRKIIPTLCALFAIQDWVLLFKPQFEVGREHIRKGGVVKDPQVTQRALEDFSQFMREQQLVYSAAPSPSPVTGKKSGNQEYLVHYVPITH